MRNNHRNMRSISLWLCSFTVTLIRSDFTQDLHRYIHVSQFHYRDGTMKIEIYTEWQTKKITKWSPYSDNRLIIFIC